MTVFEQQNLKDLRRLGFVQISNPEAAKNLCAFIQANFPQDFPSGLKVIFAVGHYGTDNYIIHAVPQILKRFQNDIQARIDYGKNNLNRLQEALRIITR